MARTAGEAGERKVVVLDFNPRNTQGVNILELTESCCAAALSGQRSGTQSEHLAAF